MKKHIMIGKEDAKLSLIKFNSAIGLQNPKQSLPKRLPKLISELKSLVTRAVYKIQLDF